MKLAAIDIGTNSTRILIGDYYNNQFFTLERKMKITRLGKDINKNNTISKFSAEKTLNALKSYNKLMKIHNVKKYRAVGTSALRKASNSRSFLLSVKKLHGIEVDIISGDEEACLSFHGAVRDINKINVRGSLDSSLKILVMDIGGGSSEFILGKRNSNPDFINSANIGCVTLSERFLNSDKPDAENLNKMRSYIKEKLLNITDKINKIGPSFIAGVAGTITTLAAIDLKLKIYDSERIHGHILKLEKINNIYKLLCDKNLEDRKKVIGLDPGRADIIIAGTAIVLEVLKSLSCDFIYVSEKDILDGIIYTLVDF